eukprot:34538-Prymnesium_polylepis.1
MMDQLHSQARPRSGVHEDQPVSSEVDAQHQEQGQAADDRKRVLHVTAIQDRAEHRVGGLQDPRFQGADERGLEAGVVEREEYRVHCDV